MKDKVTAGVMNLARTVHEFATELKEKQPKWTYEIDEEEYLQRLREEGLA